MHSDKHIVWIIPGFAESEKDDTTIPMLLDLLQYIQQNEKLKISVIALQYPFTSQPYQVYGAEVYPLNGKNKWFNKISVWKKSLQILESLHAKSAITTIHSFWLGDAALIAEAFAKQKNIKHICTLMGQDVLKTNRHLKNKRLKSVPLIALSEFHAEVYYKNTGTKPDAIIPFGMPDTSFEASEKKYDVIGVGSLIPVKNYEMWVEIIELVKKSIPEVKAILVGDGEQRKEIEELIDAKKLGNNIELLGLKKRADTLQLMNQSRIFLHTSKHEGQGYIFTEAMSRKLPILSTPVGYSIEDEKIWKGIDPEKFADEIVHILRKGDVKISYKFPLASDTFRLYQKYYK